LPFWPIFVYIFIPTWAALNGVLELSFPQEKPQHSRKQNTRYLYSQKPTQKNADDMDITDYRL
jgi:hypothetical protein